MALMPYTDPSYYLRRKLAFALDYPDLESAAAGAEKVRESVGTVKVGLELFAARGPEAVRAFRELGFDVFLDLKLHDIPETVDRAVGVACSLGARFLTVHASGGPRMLEKAAQRADKEGTGLVLLAVTVLTSLDEGDLQRVGVFAEPVQQVLRLAALARDSGIPGLVCSSAEVSAVRSALGKDVVLVVPGIRPAGADVGDQKRVATPSSAIRDGATVLVVGRPIRDAADPASAAAGILEEIRGAT